MSQQHVTTAPPGELYWRYTIPQRSDSKMFLLTKGGVAVVGNWSGALGEFFLAWCPMPKRNRALEESMR